MAYGLSKTGIRDRLYIKRTSFSHYQRLASYHYVKQSIHPFKYIFGIYPRLPWLKQYPHPVAITVYAPPLPNLRPRRRALEGILDIPRDRRQSLAYINKHIIYASRIIVDPRFKHLGLATWLAQVTYELVPYPIIEVLTPIDDTNAWLTKLGFKTFLMPAPDYYARVIRAFCRVGITSAFFDCPEFVNRRIDKLARAARRMILYELQRFTNHFKCHHLQPHSLRRTAYILDKLHYPHAYHVLIKDIEGPRLHSDELVTGPFS